MTNPNIEKGFSRNKSLSNTLRKEGKSSEAFEIMLSALTLEEIIGFYDGCNEDGFAVSADLVECCSSMLGNVLDGGNPEGIAMYLSIPAFADLKSHVI